MTNPSETEPAPEPAQPARNRLLFVAKIGGPIVVVILAVWFFFSGGTEAGEEITFTARQGNLPITVVEGGTVEALESQVIQSEVRGSTKILSIVEEGYRVTEEDVANKKVLVTLDDSELEERLTQAEIEYQNAAAMYTDAQEQLEIQVKENESDLNAAELEVTFARMDFEKYLGSDLANRILTDTGLLEQEREVLEQSAEAVQVRESPLDGDLPTVDTSDGPLPLTPDLVDALVSAFGENGFDITPERLLERAEKDASGDPILSSQMQERLSEMGVDITSLIANSDSLDAASKSPLSGPESIIESARRPRRASVDFANYVDLDRLEEGEAKQLLREYTDAKLLAEEELSLARNQLDGTEQLAGRDFVTQQELETDQMKVTRSEISLEKAGTDLELFQKYEFPKQCETLLSDYEEALNKLERAQKLAVSRLAQAQGKLRSAEAQYKLKTQHRNDLIEQVANCTIVAERPGLVVYGGAEDRWRNDDEIREGATIRERQDIITIPDMTEMGANVSIHESAIKLVEAGQKARIRVEAYPDQVLTGEVVKVAVLPNSASRWLNPDLKVYSTKIAVEGTHNWLRPGMNSEVEILIEELNDVVYVPVQAVMNSGRDKVCYVATDSGPERRVVKTGSFNNEYIHIVDGLEAGERVYLRRPVEFQFEEEIEDGPATVDGDEPISEWEAREDT